jgi:non-canonical purine NTP pyrophosphatase (RdgB/HAM1 family)
MRWVFASTNPNKLKEVRELTDGSGLAFESLAEAGYVGPDAVEDGATLIENARIKALYYSTALMRPCLADDSGLEVEALGGAPGVHSAVYAGSHGTREERDRRNREKLVRELRSTLSPSRRARLVCTLCLALPGHGVVFEARGEIWGEVRDEPVGELGFGYDALLWLPDFGCMMAELELSRLLTSSHRARAMRTLVEWLGSPEGTQYFP